MASYENQLVLVTGASSGLGRALAKQFAASGAKVAFVGRDPDRVASAVAEATPACKGYVFDLTNVAGIEGLTESIQRDFGCPIDVVVHAAGTGTVGKIEETPLAPVAETITVNLVAAMGLAHAVLPKMRQRGVGKLVLVSSGTANFGVPGEAAYSASKAGVERLAESLKMELAGSGVTVHVASPGPVDTPLLRNPRRYGSAGLVARPTVALDPAVAAQKIVERLSSGATRIELSSRGAIARHLSYWAPGVLGWLLSRQAQKR